MKTMRACLFFSFAIVFSISLGEVLSFRLSGYQWKYFVFSQWWPQSQCYYKGDAGYSKDCFPRQSFQMVNEYKFRNDCVPANVDSWTIHGLWPTFNGTPYPECCNRSWPFNINNIGNLTSRMRMKWIELPDTSKSEYLWKHEWEKHGTCASSLLRNEYAYFSKALTLNAQFDLLKMLEGQGLSPSDDKTYKLRDFEDAIKKKYGVEGRVICLDGPDGYQYLAGIRICLDKTFQLIDCLVTATEGCSKRDPLKYPVINHHHN